MYSQSLAADIRARRLAMDAQSDTLEYTVVCTTHGYVGHARGHVDAMRLANTHASGISWCEPHLQVHRPQA
jgi:hypothetical protein